MLIKQITFEQIPEHIQSIIEDVIIKLKTDNIYETDKGFYVLEHVELNRVYIEIYDHDKYEGISPEELNTLIKHFKINDPHIFSHPYRHQESLMCIGKVQEDEIIY